MFIRWQSRVREDQGPKYSYGWPRGKPDVHWRAILVEAVRIHGKPRQRVVYLDGLTESEIANKEYGPRRIYDFWAKINERLDAEGDRLSPENRRRIEATIAAKVRRPSKRERERFTYNDAEWDRMHAQGRLRDLVR